MRIETIGDAVLYHGDCREILPTLPKVDAVITDPPYGIGEDGGDKQRRRGSSPLVIHKKKEWDSERPTQDVFDLIFVKSTNQAIFGANYFSDYLPPFMGWIFWDKNIGGDFSDGELIFTNRKKALRKITVSSTLGLKGGWDRQHPTQKPVRIMEYCIGLFESSNTVLDPFMGSGTTGVACVNLQRKFIGIELDEEYFNIACRRIEAAYKQVPLFGGN